MNKPTTYALLCGLAAQLADIPYEYYPNVSFELGELLSAYYTQDDTMEESQAGIYALAFRSGLLKWQAADVAKIVEAIKADYAKQIEEYKAGNKRILGFLMGEAIKRGADPNQAKEALEQI